MNYELTDETITVDGHVLYRIRALKDLPRLGVEVGDLGGFIEHEGNLTGEAWVFGEARVHGWARVFGEAQVFGESWVYGKTRVYGSARVIFPFHILYLFLE